MGVADIEADRQVGKRNGGRQGENRQCDRQR